MDDRDFGFFVPKAGVYPLTLVYYQGGGGAAVEWSQIQSGKNGTRLLVNDGTNPNSLPAFRHAVTAAVTQPHTLSVGKSGSTVTITYTGTLFSSSTINGTYTAGRQALQRALTRFQAPPVPNVLSRAPKTLIGYTDSQRNRTARSGFFGPNTFSGYAGKSICTAGFAFVDRWTMVTIVWQTYESPTITPPVFSGSPVPS